MPDTVPTAAVHTVPHAVEILYFDGCPHYEALQERLKKLLQNVGIGDLIRLHRIPNERAAQRERFLGSPTVRVGGHDVEPGASLRNNFGMACRLYPTADGLRPTPPDQWILEALAKSTRV